MPDPTPPSDLRPEVNKPSESVPQRGSVIEVGRNIADQMGFRHSMYWIVDGFSRLTDIRLAEQAWRAAGLTPLITEVVPPDQQIDGEGNRLTGEKSKIAIVIANDKNDLSEYLDLAEQLTEERMRVEATQSQYKDSHGIPNYAFVLRDYVFNLARVKAAAKRQQNKPLDQD